MNVAAPLRELVQQLRAGRTIYSGIRILNYHGVIERLRDPRVERNFHLLSDFREHVSVLRRCNVISVNELLDAPPSRSLRPVVVITFDDGFRNNLLAADLLSVYRLPFTIFVSTNNVETNTPIWPTLLRLVLARGSARRPRLAGVEYDLDGDPEAFQRVRSMFKDQDAITREQLWNELVAQLAPNELDDLISAFPSLAMLSWQHVRSLHSWGISFGSHGWNHELHHARQPLEIRRRELEHSKRQLEAATGHACTVFAFPNGAHMEHSALELRDSGYRAGFTTVKRAATRADNRLLLPRIMPGLRPEKIATALFFGS